jgi:alpha-mannosidase
MFFKHFQVNDENLAVKNSDGTIVESQLVNVDSVTGNLRKFYVKAYLGITTDKPPKYWLVFQASVPPMGWNSYYISKPTGAGESFFLIYFSY